MHRILVFVDSRWRDTIGVSLVIGHLRKKGHMAIAAPYDQWQLALELFAPNVVVINHLKGERNLAIASYIKRNGGQIFVVPTEGRPNLTSTGNWFFEQLDSPHLDTYLSWYDIDHPRSITTGCPRFEIYTTYRDYINSKRTFRDKYRLGGGIVVGITTSFPQAKFSYHGVKFNEHDWGDLGLTNVLGDASSFAKDEYRKREIFDLWLRAVKHKTGLEFILKPHPMSDMSYWEHWDVVYQDFAHNFLAGVDMLIARKGCVTVQEAWMLGIPVLQIDPGDGNARGPAHEAWVIGNKAKTPASIERFLRSPKRADKKAGDYLDKYGYNIRTPSLNVSTAIHERLPRSAPATIPLDNILRLNAVLTKHDEIHQYPDPLNMHLGKSPVMDEVYYWMRKLV